MTRRLTARIERWPLARPFAIARGVKTEAVVVAAEVQAGDVTGVAEAVPYPRYGETPDAVLAALMDRAGDIAGGLELEDLPALMPAGAARNALECALWDVRGRERNCSLPHLLGVPEPAGVVTAETIVVDTPEAMAAAAQALADHPLLKVKVSRTAVVERLQAVRAAAPNARLIVDANEGWSIDTLLQVAEPLAALRVEMIEQPLPAQSDRALQGLRLPVPLCADEACHTRDDLDRVRQRYGMINVKLDKTGGLAEALALMRAGRDMGLAIMLGCMVSTSLAIRPALALAALADLVDLDGPVWLARDREPALRFENGLIQA